MVGELLSGEQEYRDAYIQALRDAPLLGEDIFGQISSLQAMRLSDEYRAAPIKVMIMGQETYRNEVHLKSIPMLGDQWCADEYDRRVLEEIRFDFAYGKDPEGSRWWRAYSEICDHFKLPSRRATAWTNISKVQLADNSGYGVSISKLPAQSQMKLLRWQRPLLLAEIRYARPDILIMLTGGLSWMARQIFLEDDGSFATEIAIPGTPNNTKRLFSSSLGPTVAAYTLHPASRRHKNVELAEIRSTLLAWCDDERRALDVSLSAPK